MGTWELALASQQGLTALCSGFNAFYFLAYRSTHGRRRWGAMCLALVNLAFLIQSLYLGILPAMVGGDEASAVVMSPRLRLTSGTLPLVASLMMATFVVLKLKAKRG